MLQFSFMGSMTLLNGLYTVAVAVNDHMHQVCLDAQDHAARFSVVSNSRCAGIVGLCHSVEVSIEDALGHKTLLSKSKA